ncbi:hypothetical protein F0M18_13560 [Pseudohalioglobus sediminis]|uniref:Uncharacterized protein n=1 Tax=Pseudohalioglobus sediminis TaxID=2606449 RepID=A0A5B0WUI2_9GAMM|nr:hypothetical protein [Pseudohalioglobus sediminis]KAA1190087.1 hypothetical protein F0M18_13560 [Pseudohalioglobus sediminis]
MTRVCRLVGLATALAIPTATLADGFDNGFEGNDLGGWQLDPAPPADTVEVIEGPEGPALFPIYNSFELAPDGQVSPRLGDYMLRLGTPKLNNETQNRGVNGISQEFVAESPALAIALRLFSTDHRGDDILRISLSDSSGLELASDNTFEFNNAAGDNCRASCEATIDTGKRKDVIDSGWQDIQFSGLAAGEIYTLRIELEAGQNESLSSWLYVDGVNAPPTASINFNPGQSGPAVEGDFVVFDCLDSVDPENSELACIWTAEFAGVSPQPIIGRTVVYSFPNDGTGTINLEVTDGEESTTASTSITIQNQEPLVNALNVEVLPGASVDLVCRFADPGAADTHSVDISVSGGTTGDIEIDTENVPALSSGVARTSFTAPEQAGDISGSCSVTDDSGSTGSDNFTISVLEVAALQDRVAANTGSTVGMPQVLPTDQSSLGGLKDPNSLAVYEIRLPNGGPLPAGTEVSVTAKFPVDYDIVLLNGSTETISAAPWVSAPFVSAPFVSAPFVSVPFVSAPFVSAPFVSAPFVSAPFVSAPFVSAPFVSAPFVSAPFVSAPFVSAPLTTSLWEQPGFLFENFPLSQLAGAPDGSNISGIDVSFQDLGALGSGDLTNEAVFVKGLSAEFGTNTEQLLVEIGPGEQGLYLAVIPQAGSFSAAPFNLEVEAAIPPETASLLGPACAGTPLVANPSTGIETLRAYGSKTLIVTQKQRMMATFDMDDAEWEAWMLAMDPFFSHPSVQATVISVPGNWYDTADMEPCNVQAQNAVAANIKGAIDSARTEATQFVQLMGSLDIIMPYYLPDETQTGNEALFAADLLTLPGTPLGVAISEGYMLTDAFYVDADPQPFNGRLLYLEDISISRLVETPGEILANAQRFVETGGVINILSVEAGTPGAGTQSTGYDFFIDGTDVINDILDSDYPGTNTTRNDDSWDAATLRCQFFGAGENCSKPISAVNAVNAHMSYNAGLTAKGFNCQYRPQMFPELCADEIIDPLGEVFLSTESASIYEDPDADGPAIAINGVTFSIGCHSGLSVPDAWGLPEILDLPLDPAKDWVQELGTWVGSYNFAYGDTDVADRGTEGIMPLVIANFAEGMSLGQALTEAKWQYGAGLFEFGVYDEKSLVGLNLFGMPQATLESSVTTSTLATSAAGSASGTSTGDELVVNLEETDTGGPTINSSAGGSIDLHSNDKGIWYSISGNAQAIVGRPLLPVLKPFELRPVGTTSVHAVALRGGTFTTYLDEDPVFPAQTHDLVTDISEPQPCVETLSPSLIASVNTFDSPNGLLQSLVIQPGQFKCTDSPAAQDADGYQVNGDFRIWNSIDLELLHPATVALDSDRQPPEVTRQDLLGDPATGIVNATLDAEDPSGIREVIALVYRDDDGLPGGTGTATPYSTTTRNGDGLFELVLPNAFDNLLSFQYIDEAGNITAKTLKGALLRAIEVTIRTSIISQGSSTQVVVEIGDFDKLVAPYMVVDFGDGSEPLLLELDEPDPELFELVNNPDGSATVTIDYDYSGFTGNSITIRVEVRSAGGLGNDEKTISLCSDQEGDVSIPAADIIGCGVTSEGTELTIDVILAADIAADIQYRLVLPDTNTQIKYADGSVTGPKNLKISASAVSSDRISFTFDARRLNWDGVAPFRFLFQTQDGVSGGQGQGFVDSTDVKLYEP